MDPMTLVMLITILSFIFTFGPALGARAIDHKAQQPKAIEKKFDPHWTRQKEIELFGWDWVKIMGHECTCGVCAMQLTEHEASLIPKTQKAELKLAQPTNAKYVTRGGFRFCVPDYMPDDATSVVDYDYITGMQRAKFKWYNPVTGQAYGYQTYSMTRDDTWHKPSQQWGEVKDPDTQEVLGYYYTDKLGKTRMRAKHASVDFSQIDDYYRGVRSLQAAYNRRSTNSTGPR